MHRAFAFFGFILLALGASFAPAHAVPDTANTCFSNWSDAAPIVARERLLAARDVQEMIRRTLPGDVVRITLCREEAGYVYLLLLRDGHGHISNLKIDAHGDRLR